MAPAAPTRHEPTRIFADDTRLPGARPRPGSDQDRVLVGHAIDDRPWGGHTPPAVVHLYAEDRKGEHPAAHLAGVHGHPAGRWLLRFQGPAGGPPADQIKLAFCWAHCRRGFYELYVHGLAAGGRGAAPDR